MDASLPGAYRAANYRHAAEAWRNLARDSFVELSLAASGSLGNNARTWLVTVDSPPQMLDVQVDSLNSGRAGAGRGGLGLLLFAVAELALAVASIGTLLEIAWLFKLKLNLNFGPGTHRRCARFIMRTASISKMASG